MPRFVTTVATMLTLFIAGANAANASNVLVAPILGGFEYTIVNSADSPLHVAAMAVATPAVLPVATSNQNWLIQALNPTAWEGPMGEIAGNLSWSQYTHVSWNQAFGDEQQAAGYFLGYQVAQGGLEITIDPTPIPPGAEPLDGFFAQNIIVQTIVASPLGALPFTPNWILAGPGGANGPFPVAQLLVTGPNLPEPSSLVTLAIGGLLAIAIRCTRSRRFW